MRLPLGLPPAKWSTHWVRVDPFLRRTMRWQASERRQKISSLSFGRLKCFREPTPSKNRIHGVGRGDQTISRGRYPGVEHSRWVCRPCRGGIRGSRIHGRSISSFRARIHSKDKITLTYCFKESFLYQFNARFEESLSLTLRCFLEG